MSEERKTTEGMGYDDIVKQFNLEEIKHLEAEIEGLVKKIDCLAEKVGKHDNANIENARHIALHWAAGIGAWAGITGFEWIRQITEFGGLQLSEGMLRAIEAAIASPVM